MSRVLVAAIAVLAVAAANPAQAQLKIAFIDPLSGMMAAVGDHGLRELRFAADRINAQGGILAQKIEVLGWDNKLSPLETQALIHRAIDEGIHYVFQGNGASVANAIIDALNKHNERHPDRRVLYFNYQAPDPDFTNAKCSYWHFRFDADADQKVQALISYMATRKDEVKKVYLLNQDYQFGRRVSRTSRDLIQQRVPTAQIVGDELHALAKVKDFAPYISKIQASGADTVVTGNWGTDLALLVRAARDAGLKARFYTLYAEAAGTPAALGDAALGRVFNATSGDKNKLSPEGERYTQEFKAKYGQQQDPYTLMFPVMLDLLRKAATQVNSLDPDRVAAAMEGMKGTSFFGPIEMRKDNHQLIQNQYVVEFAKVDGKAVKYNADGTIEYGFKSVFEVPAELSRLPTSCNMQRPTS